MERRLAAIMAADVVGYSKLMGEDESGTLGALRQLRRETIAPALVKHCGNLIKSMGDGWLVEFSSASEAVAAAIEIQKALVDNNIIKLRIGLHIGDVTFEDEDIYGDGVNIAARLQEFARPGTIIISDFMKRSIGGKLAEDFAELGPQTLKNIAEPVIVFGWGLSEATGQNGFPRLMLPDKPSIAVLPFVNMSGDKEQEYFSDGITEDIITSLSKFSSFFVIARNSSFTYKGRAVDIRKIGAELGVRYVLEGSVRKASERVRITAQLIEVETRKHIWAERFDRQLNDVFELQDEITRTIVVAVEPEITQLELHRAFLKPTGRLAAWELYQRGVAKVWESSRESILEAMEYFSRAIAIDSNFAAAFGFRAFAIYNLVICGWASDDAEFLSQGLSDANRAIQLEHRDYIGHYALGRLLALGKKHAAAVVSLEYAISLNPNFAHGYYGLAVVHLYAGDPEIVLQYIDKALRLSPQDPLLWAMLMFKAHAHGLLGNVDSAREYLEQAALLPNASFLIFASLAVRYAELGRVEESKKALARAIELNPELSVHSYREGVLRINPRAVDHVVRFIRQAGLTE